MIAPDIKKQLGVDKPTTQIVSDIIKTRDSFLAGQLFKTGLCKGYDFNPKPDRFFVAQEFNQSRDDFRESLLEAFREVGYRPIQADDFYETGHILCKICGLIQSTPFGVYQLSKSQNRNVYLELGIAIGLQKPFILVKETGAKIASIINGLEYFSLSSYFELKQAIANKIETYIADVHRSRNFVSGLGEYLEHVFVSHGDLEVVDFCLVVSQTLSSRNLKSVIAGGGDSNELQLIKDNGVISFQTVGSSTETLLQKLVTSIGSARFGIYRIDKDAAPDAFVALGIALALGRPFILVKKESAEMPSDLGGLSEVSFYSLKSLSELLSDALKQHVD